MSTHHTHAHPDIEMRTAGIHLAIEAYKRELVGLQTHRCLLPTAGHSTATERRTIDSRIETLQKNLDWLEQLSGGSGSSGSESE